MTVVAQSLPTFVYCLIFITAVSHGSVAKQGLMSYCIVCLIPAPFNLFDLEGSLTGVMTLACIILLTTNKKAQTKSIFYGVIKLI